MVLIASETCSRVLFLDMRRGAMCLVYSAPVSLSHYDNTLKLVYSRRYRILHSVHLFAHEHKLACTQTQNCKSVQSPLRGF